MGPLQGHVQRSRGEEMSTTPRKEFVFTGWHMLGAMLLFFGIVISVNLYMAWQATRSWSGLVVENTYIASQEFNGKVADAKALAASGVTGSLRSEERRVGKGGVRTCRSRWSPYH